MNPGPWTPAETRVLLAAYDRMLALQSRGLLGRGNGRVTKASIVRELMEALPGRTRGSIEAKAMNVSAARRMLGLPGIVDGYKPLPNYTRDLPGLVRDWAAAGSNSAVGGAA